MEHFRLLVCGLVVLGSHLPLPTWPFRIYLLKCARARGAAWEVDGAVLERLRVETGFSKAVMELQSSRNILGCSCAMGIFQQQKMRGKKAAWPLFIPKAKFLRHVNVLVNTTLPHHESPGTDCSVDRVS